MYKFRNNWVSSVLDSQLDDSLLVITAATNAIALVEERPSYTARPSCTGNEGCIRNSFGAEPEEQCKLSVAITRDNNTHRTTRVLWVLLLILMKHVPIRVIALASSDLLVVTRTVYSFYYTARA